MINYDTYWAILLTTTATATKSIFACDQNQVRQNHVLVHHLIFFHNYLSYMQEQTMGHSLEGLNSTPTKIRWLLLRHALN